MKIKIIDSNPECPDIEITASTSDLVHLNRAIVESLAYSVEGLNADKPAIDISAVLVSGGGYHLTIKRE